ncbi:MAG: phage antirepressor [Campylobacteraceae bacterium]|jgi:prophage antirepressor-like protein|nr:phage antirepressor [Campylobacteraceae bacterium]
MELQIFQNSGFKIRGGLFNNEPYFVLADVCKALDINNVSQLKTRLKKDGVITNEVIDSLGRVQQATFINESNLYKTIFQSKKDEALIFQEWVTSEVLPTIRKHGVYATEQKLEEMIANPDFTIKLLETIKQERAQREQIQSELDAQAPRVAFAQRLQKCEGTLSVRDYAKLLCDKGLPLGEKRLFERLRNLGILMRDNKPYQHYIDNGVLAVKEGIYINSTTGDDVAYMQVRVTAKGQEYIYNKLLGHSDDMYRNTKSNSMTAV